MSHPNSYTPFGDTLSTTAGETARIGFIGQEQDIEHGYFNMGARYYDPEIGRFLSVDPLFSERIVDPDGYRERCTQNIHHITIAITAR